MSTLIHSDELFIQMRYLFGNECCCELFPSASHRPYYVISEAIWIDLCAFNWITARVLH